MSVRVPDERLDELARLAENATPGPWRSDIPRVLACDPRQTIVAEITGAPSNPETAADAEFIAAAGTDLAALAEDLRAARADNQRLRESLGRATYVAEHLFGMVDRETWRATGGDDRQGHYEGDYRAEQTQAEILAWKALAEEPRA